MRWDWNEAKNRSNQRKHRLSFEQARRVFDDPFAISKLDTRSQEERWHTVGMVEGVVIIVVHTWQADDETRGPYEHEGAGRLISARKATRRETKAYEEGEF